MRDGDLREQILGLEAQIEELAETIESCRKIIQISKAFIVVGGLLIAAISAIALAQAPANPPVRIRGVVEKVDGQVLTVKATNGQTMTVKLAVGREQLPGGVPPAPAT